jgi:hypothetical protein
MCVRAFMGECVFVCVRARACVCMYKYAKVFFFYFSLKKRPSNYYPATFDLYLYCTKFYFLSKLIRVRLQSLKWERMYIFRFGQEDKIKIRRFFKGLLALFAIFNQWPSC